MGVRAESRERTIAALKRLGRAQLAEVGAPGLSLRAIARDLGMVSSAVYRYFPSRDALLTALIIDAYDDLGQTAEAADCILDRGEPMRRLLAIAGAVRTWALAHPNEYALIFGSPVPGYQAPQDTIAPASRVPLLLLDVLKSIDVRIPQSRAFSPQAQRAIAPLRRDFAPELDPTTLSLGYTLWEFIVGAVSMEAFGHQRNTIEPSAREVFFAEQVRSLATLLLQAD